MMIKLTSTITLLSFAFYVAAYGDYVPKSLFLMDEFGRVTEEFKVRTKRDVENVIRKVKRSPGNEQSGGGAYSYSGSYSGSGPGAEAEFIPHFSNFAAHIPTSFEDLQNHAANFANFHQKIGAAPSPDNLGYTGPVLFSRSGVEKGSGIKVASSAQGPNAAFSSSFTSSDGQGNVRYDVKSGKY